MKRRIRIVLAVAIAVFGVTTGVSAADGSYTVKSFHADYYLGADKEGRSTLKTVETLVVEFPADGSRQAVTQALPEQNDGHPNSLKIVSVTDQAGHPIGYSTSHSDGNKVLRIGGSAMTRGDKTYVVTYTQRDVTMYDAKAKQHEFAWNVAAGLGREVGQVSATVHSDKNVAPTLNKNVSCQVGSTACIISEQGDIITASAGNLQTGQGMAIVVGFTPGTFRAYAPSANGLAVGVWVGAGIIFLIVGVLIILWLSSLRKLRRTKN